MVAPDAAELISRTRAILGYTGMSQAKFAETTGVKASDLKSWLDSSKPAHPGMEQVVRMAEAVDIPPRFAERGFEDLREPTQDGAMLSRIAELEEEVRRLVARDARREVEAPTQSAASPKRASRSRTRPQQ